MTAVEITAPAAAPRSRQLALAAMLLAVAMTFIDQTIVAIASPTIQSHLALSRTDTQWMVNAYLVALAAAFAFGGRLTDLLGSRRMVIIGIVGFAAASALCGATPTGAPAVAWIIAFRAVQGAAGAIMIPAALAVVVAAFPVHERGRALALFFGVSGALTSVGPIAGGWLTHWTWRAIFWINVPIAILALIVAALAGIPDVRGRGRLDLRGAVLITAGMGLSVLGFQQAQTWGWASPATWFCIVAGLASIVVFGVVQTRTRDPLIQMRVFRSRAFLLDNAVLFFALMAFVPVFFFAAVYAQVALGYDASHAGLYLLVFFAGFGPAAQLGGRMLDRAGARRPMVLGSTLSCVGFALWAGHLHRYDLGAQWVFIVMAGAGLGLLIGPASTDAVNRAVDASYGEVTGITQTVRNFGSSLGLAVLGTVLMTVLRHRLTESLAGLGLPHSIAADVAARAARTGSTVAAQAPPDLRDRLAGIVVTDFATATQWVLYGMAIALGICLLIAIGHPATATDPALTEPIAEIDDRVTVSR